ncbi:MAG: NAD(P)/FAD-dependent oxidoreductase, partial [Gammaproteobacteria bacterium]
TSASGGILAYSPVRDRPPRWHALASVSLEAHRRLEGQLSVEVPAPPKWTWTGRLEVALNGEGEEFLRAQTSAEQKAGSNVTWLEPDAVMELEPNIVRTWGGAFDPDAGFVNPGTLAGALLESAYQSGAVTMMSTRVVGLLVSGSSAYGVRTSDGKHVKGDVTIICTGVWTAPFSTNTTAPRITPLRGQVALLQDPDTTALFRSVIYGAGIYIVPRDDGVLVGASREEVGFTQGNTVGAIAGLLRAAETLLPSIAVCPWHTVSVRNGFRPQSETTVPVIGPDLSVKNLWWATGHFDNGILLAPLTAELALTGIEGALDPRIGPPWE